MRSLCRCNDSFRHRFVAGPAARQAILALALGISAIGPRAAIAQAGRSPVPAKHGMVASSHYLASEVGVDILKRGGNAIDAAVATAFAAAVVFPAAGNVGGGGFIVYHGADGEVTAFNFREKAPIAAGERMFATDDDEIATSDFAWKGAWGGVDDEANHEGLLSVGVPGTVAGLYLAHQRLGRLPWSELVQPAIDLARDGFPLSWAELRIQETIARNAEKYRSTADAFLKEGDAPHEPGEIWKQPDLAVTLERIRDDGRDGFYKGETARLIADFMRKHGGLITEEDLARYQATEQPPIHGTYRGYDIYAMSPPSSGGVALVEMLNILEGQQISGMGHNSAQYLHTITEAMRVAFRDRATFIGDPDFNPDMPIQRLTSKSYADSIRATISPAIAGVSDSSLAISWYESEETTHFSVVDSAGNAVSFTTTLEYGYGSRIVVEGAGFLLNNEMGDFNPIPGLTDTRGYIGTPPNLVAPEKRMLSSMTPTIVASKGKPVLVVGTPGGRTIINSVLQVILNVIDFRMNVALAVEAPRIHHQWLPDEVRHESFGFSLDTMEKLRLMGHDVVQHGEQGQVNAIYIDHQDGMLYGAADSRAFDSRAVGF